MTAPQVSDILDGLTDAQKAVLLAMDPDYGWPFDSLAERTDLKVAEIRRIVRDFYKRHLACYGPLYSDDDSSLRGRGYWLSRTGHQLRLALREASSKARTDGGERG